MTNLEGQCPGAFDCMQAEVLCSIGALNGFTCNNPTTTNTQFPFANLCHGTGVPTNLNYWGFIGSGGPLSLSFSFDPASCEFHKGIQAGVFEGLCGGVVWDCNADCTSSNFSLTGITTACQVYYLWVDGCEHDVCLYTMSAVGNQGHTLNPTPPPVIETGGGDCIGEYAEFCISSFTSGCYTKIDWTIDGVPVSNQDCFEYLIQSEKPLEVCYTVTTGLNSICNQASSCQTFIPKVDIRVGPLRLLCPRNETYYWHGMPIISDCVNPPCTARINVPGGCFIDSIVPFRFIPPEIQIGSKITVPLDQQPYFWHGMPITSSCITPPCTARVESINGCIVDSVRQIELLRLPDSMVAIIGNVNFDINNNCQINPVEPPIKDMIVMVEGQKGNFQTLTDSNGEFQLVLPLDEYIVNVFDPIEEIYSCPLNQIINANRENVIHKLDFNKPDSMCFPVRMKILPLTGRNRYRCDRYTRTFELEISNLSLDTIKNEAIILQIDNLMKLTNASVQHLKVSDQEIIVNLPNLSPREILDIKIQFEPNCSLQDETETVCLTASFENDYICMGNELNAQFCSVIRNSRDPNDLTVMPFGILDKRYITRDQLLKGLIRYHNTGTDTAYDIFVDLNFDVLQFEMSTFKILSSSVSEIAAEIMDSGVRFTMNNIRLPHNSVDSIRSHGFIEYEIFPFNGLNDWEEIDQQAFIYFDHNPPVPTNVERHTIEGPYFFAFDTIDLCENDIFMNYVITMDTTIMDTLFLPGPDSLLTYEIRVSPEYYFTVDTQILAGDFLHGNRIERDTVIQVDLSTNFGCDSVVVYIIDAIPTLVRDHANDIIVFPNPTASQFITIANCPEKCNSISLINFQGRRTNLPFSGSQNCTVDLSQMESGVYIIQLVGDSGVIHSGKVSITP